MRMPLKPAPQNALVLGLGDSGEAAARVLGRLGSRVCVLDRAGGADREARQAALERESVRVRLGATELPEERFDLAIVSPGIPESAPWVRALEARGVPVWSELELGWRLTNGRVLAVTGSNGKSTLVTLCRDALRAAGRRAVLAGNCGPPVCDVVLRAEPLEWLVLEVSTFQLERVVEFRPDIGILLNVYPNHLDRHGRMEVYTALKARLFARMGAGCHAIAGEDVPASVRFAAPPAAGWTTFGAGEGAGYRVVPGAVRCRASGRTVDIADTAFDNEVLGLTAAAAVAAVEAAGEDAACVSEAARRFERLPHRLQPVGAARGVRFVDDSKATNLAALSAALRVVPGPVRLIAGGLLKERALDGIQKILFKNVARVYIIGACADELWAAWNSDVPCVVCREMKQALGLAWKEAAPGETILLSPGCASFDQFRSFGDRGEQFTAMANVLMQGGEP